MLQAACEIDIAAAAVRNEKWGAENKIEHCILSAPPTFWTPPFPQTPPSLAAVSCPIRWQLRFGQAVKNDSIVLFGGIFTRETSTNNWEKNYKTGRIKRSRDNPFKLPEHV